MKLGKRVSHSGLFILLLAAFCLPGGGQTLDTRALFDGVERAFREKESRWKIERADVSGAPRPMTQNILFRSGKAQAHVQLIVWDRAEVARDAFAGEVIAEDNIRGRGSVRRRLPNLGDEAYVWTSRGSTAWPLLRSRSGRVVFTVFAPTTATARRFARRVAEQIDGLGRLRNKE